MLMLNVSAIWAVGLVLNKNIPQRATMRFKKLETGKQRGVCYLCEEKRELYISDSDSKLIAPNMGAFQVDLNDPDTDKVVKLTWIFADSEGKVVSLCNECSGYVLGMLANAYLDGKIKTTITPLEDD